MPYDIQPRLTSGKIPPMRPTHKRTPSWITFTQLNPISAHLGSVSSVLDSVSSVLASIDDSHAEEQVSVEAPASRNSGFASQLSFRSRSPSPLGTRNATAGVVPVHNLLLSPHAPPTTTYDPDADGYGDGGSSSATTTVQEQPLASLPDPNAPFQHSHPSSNTNSPNAGFSPLLPSSHPPYPTHAAKKRLSFISYSDLLSSTPTSTLPLSSLTTSASTFEPPPHIPSVSGLGIVSGGIGGVWRVRDRV
ncbi:hypothetical protein K443DRAFT_11356 [Laccaria amethystina LaAM-08-1]|uniref:Uncharacterized protein n=1 Tax=Laccaria amethystina LaAM-08-1 TaxID=1095629 RepID=A0A0C9XHC0_9AGAR|nr:hypothetical protein K443DRAFT_11356 [Laccaria amethystina LaAM-08-1]